MTHLSTLKAILIFTSIFLGLSFSLDAQKLKIPQGNLGGGGGEIFTYFCYNPSTPQLHVTISNNCNTDEYDDSDCNRIHFKDLYFTKYIAINSPFPSAGIIVPQGGSVSMTFIFSPLTWANMLNNVNNITPEQHLKLKYAVTFAVEEPVVSEDNMRVSSKQRLMWSEDVKLFSSMKWEQSTFCYNGSTTNPLSTPRLAQTEVSEKITISPNPSKENISIDYNLKEEAKVSAFLYNAIGQKVKTIVNNELQSEGAQNINISIEDLKAGIYYFIIRDGNRTRTEKIVKV